jgi:DNA-binding NtrC family response regulator
MTVPIIGDRFVLDGPAGWIDLATGACASLTFERRPGQNLDPECPTLIDCGWASSGVWYAARAVAPAALPAEAGARGLADAVHRIVSAVPLDSPRPGVVSIRVEPPEVGAGGLAIASAAARRLRPLGFVTVRARLALVEKVWAALRHRHLAFVACDDEDAEAMVRAIRRVSGVSARTHLALDLRYRRDRYVPRKRAPLVLVARQPSPSYGPDCVLVESRGAQGRLARASAALGRGRGAAGERWLRAALESARRRGDEGAMARVTEQLVTVLLDREAWTCARDLTLGALATLDEWAPRATVAVPAATTLMALGELERADVLIAGIEAEARMRDCGVPPPVRLCLAQLRFWQGRFEEARAALPLVIEDEPAPAALALWTALVGWAVGDSHGLEQASHAIATHARDSGRWSPALVRLAYACETERRLVEGGQSGPCQAPPYASAPALERALLDRLRSCVHEDAESGARAGLFIERSGARGLARWGLGRKGMHLLQAMPALLTVIHDAEDEMAVLDYGCRWLRGQARAVAVGVASADGTQLVAADGLSMADLDLTLIRDAVRSEQGRTVALGADLVTVAPVRWAGSRIGVVIARGAAVTGATLAELASTWAALCAPALRTRLDAVALVDAARTVAPEILGQSAIMGDLRESIARAAATSFPVLVEGESGTGKELVARALHRLSARRDRRFCAVNCAALTDELVEAELFGSARGAFTGAVGARAGLFEEAHGGTLFLDEIGELSPRAQAKVLRAVQEREIRRLGENSTRAVDVRIIAATNRPLADASAQGLFRDDLLFRLAVVRCRLPPLRERIEDVPLLAHAFWRRMAPETGKAAALGPDAIAALCHHRWPGNVRELQNIVAALLVIAPTRGRISARHVQQVLGEPGPARVQPGVSLQTARLALERRVVSDALARHAGRRAATARELGLSRQGLAKAIKRLGLAHPEPAAGVA